MTAAQDQSVRDLRGILGQAHAEADQLLADPEGNRLEVVSWLSAHVAAFEHAVYPVVKRHVPDGSALVKDDRDVVSRLARALRMLERRHSGDVLATGLSADRLAERLRELVVEHREVQGQIVDSLEQPLDEPAMRDLMQSYEDALAHAPTRPHPHLHSGLMFRLDALWDRVLDTMDGRHVPVPRVPRRLITPGRWGSYLLGQPHEASAEPRGPGASA